MGLFFVALAILILGGLASCLAGRRELSDRLGSWSALGGSLLGLAATLRHLPGEGALFYFADWSLPFGGFVLRLDALAGVFLLPVFLLAAACAWSGGASLASLARQRHLGPHWLFFNLLVAAMVLVVLAADGLLFLISWEAMSLAPFFLVSFHDSKAQVRFASWIYLVAAHVGSLFLLVFFIKMYLLTGSLLFTVWELWGAVPVQEAGPLFCLALLGFGAKAGLVPLHVWLPEAHPAAPSHISALMSGALIKMGIYGLLRSLVFLNPSYEWGLFCLLLGLAGGVLGILWALAQPDLKRLLAFSSVENMGIALVGIALAIIGRACHLPGLTGLALAGLLLHVLNHSLCKGLLFLGAGAVLHACGTVVMDLLGGLQKRMPVTGACFLLGVLGISGLPPLNGFAAKFLLYLSLALPGRELGEAGVVLTWLGILALAAMSGFSLLAMIRAFAVSFLGEPRSGSGLEAHDPPRDERLTLLGLALLCLLCAWGAPFMFRMVQPAVLALPGVNADPVLTGTAETALFWISGLSLALWAGGCLLFWLRRRLLARRKVNRGLTWDCGYLAPSPRMQYTGGSSVQMITQQMRRAIRQREALDMEPGYFPEKISFASQAPDWVRQLIYDPVFAFLAQAAGRFKYLQHGRINVYILYILVALLAALLWKL